VCEATERTGALVAPAHFGIYKMMFADAPPLNSQIKMLVRNRNANPNPRLEGLPKGVSRRSAAEVRLQARVGDSTVRNFYVLRPLQLTFRF
jgi:hypothetical protein